MGNWEDPSACKPLPERATRAIWTSHPWSMFFCSDADTGSRAAGGRREGAPGAPFCVFRSDSGSRSGLGQLRAREASSTWGTLPRARLRRRSGAPAGGDDRATATKVREPRTSAAQCFVGGAHVRNGYPCPEWLPMWTGIRIRSATGWSSAGGSSSGQGATAGSGRLMLRHARLHRTGSRAPASR